MSVRECEACGTAGTPVTTRRSRRACLSCAFAAFDEILDSEANGAPGRRAFIQRRKAWGVVAREHGTATANETRFLPDGTALPLMRLLTLADNPTLPENTEPRS